MKAAVVYPHQLFIDSPLLKKARHFYVVEDPLFFSQYRFHRQKLMLHRASMRWYADYLRHRSIQVTYIEAATLPNSTDLGFRLRSDGVTDCFAIDPEDDYLRRDLAEACQSNEIHLEVIPDPNFLTPIDTIESFVSGKQKYFFTSFYIEQRKRLRVLLDEFNSPEGGKWSFDTDNRKRLPKEVVVPAFPYPKEDAFAIEARQYVSRCFPNAIGEDRPLLYPHDDSGAIEQCDIFVRERLALFGDYEDAISQKESTLFHSVLTPALNVGLLSPRTVVDRVVAVAENHSLNSVEGFVRQVIGWREYMRLVYRTIGRHQRCRNYWGHHRALPSSFYKGTTGIEPVDKVIRRVLSTGYCHHIERLMVLGNFMLLCEFHPDAIYQWFMELFVDAYDWVMVPNVYGMSQFADGGKITTKPYISGSSYILKMSDWKKGDWCPIWDGLYWRFIANHREFFESNPRMKVMTGQLDRMGEKLQTHRRTAEQFLSELA